MKTSKSQKTENPDRKDNDLTVDQIIIRAFLNNKIPTDKEEMPDDIDERFDAMLEELHKNDLVSVSLTEKEGKMMRLFLSTFVPKKEWAIMDNEMLWVKNPAHRRKPHEYN